jgi:hypothetical protein
MSPHFMGQPAANVVVPREGWYAAPATSPEESGNAQAIQNAPPFGPADNSSRR